MSHAYLAVQRMGPGVRDLLVAQKNVYLPPHRRYQFASIARNAVQYVIPGGRMRQDETPLDAALREFHEDTGVHVASSQVEPLFREEGVWFFRTVNPPGIDIDTINKRLTDGVVDSLKMNHFAWVQLEQATCSFGNKAEYQTLPWVTTQIVRALSAGFGKELISHRANESHAIFSMAVAHLLLKTYAASEPPSHRDDSATPQRPEMS